jgi:hypothetical protein
MWIKEIDQSPTFIRREIRVRGEERSTVRARGKSLFGLRGWHQPDKSASNFIVLVLISERNI